MNFILEQTKRIEHSNTRVVFPEGNDKRIIQAASQVLKQGIAIPTLLGDEEEIRIIAIQEKIDLNGIAIVNPATSTKMADYIDIYSVTHNNFPKPTARFILSKKVSFGAMMVHAGEADAMVAGVATATEEVVMASNLIIGLDKGITTPSSFMIMDIPGYHGPEGSTLMFADPGVNPDPTSEQLADIAISSARSAKLLFDWEPRVALLSFSTHGSASHPRVTKIKDTLKIIQQREPSLLIDGELQVDAALVPEVAEKKIKRASSVAGKANILVFPDLDSGNIAFKLVQRLANAGAYGPFLQGFAKPVSDLSRGSTVEDILGVTTMAVIEVQARRQSN